MYEMMAPHSVEAARWELKLHGPKPKACNLFFTETWPFDWCASKYFEIVKTVIVPFQRGLILLGGDYVDVALNNNNATQMASLNMYPITDGVVYEILVGMNPGNYQIGIYIPSADQYLLQLAYSNMYPNLTNIINMYLGEYEPDDSPSSDPTIKLWAINQMQAWILKTYVRPGCDYEKVVFNFKIAKHTLSEPLSKPPAVFDTLEYFSDQKETT